MKLSRLYNSNFFFLVYFILCGYYLFFDITLNSFSLSGEISFFKVLMFFISTLFFIYFLLEINRKKNKNIISFSKNSQKDYLDLFNNNSNIHAILDYHGNFTYMSQSSKTITGLDHQSLIGKEFFKMIHPDDVNEVKNNFKKVLKKEKIDLIEFRIKNSINNWIWLETKIENKIDKFKIEGIILNARDVTKSIKEKQHLKLLESVITNTKDAVLITEAEPFDEPGPRIIYVNEAFTKMTGYSSKEVIGKTPRILQGPKSNKEELAKLSKAIRNWQPYEITTINYKKNGEEFWINFTVTPVINKKGFYTHWVAIERDVTDKILSNKKLIKAKEKAEENELKLKEAQKLAKLGSWYFDIKRKESYWSEETYNIWGVDSKLESVKYVDHKKIVHPKDWNRFESVIENAIEEKIPYKMEIELVMPNKSTKIVNTIGNPIFNKKNELVAFEGTTQDITELVLKEQEVKKALKIIEKNQHSINQVSKLAKVGFWEYEFETKKLIWSDYIYQLYNFNSQDYIPNYEDAFEYFDTHSQQKIVEATKQLLETGNSYDLELRMFSSRNEEIWVRNVVQPVFNNHKEIIGKRGIVQNITEEKYLRDLNSEVAKMVKIGSWNVDLEKQTVFWSNEIHDLHETDSKTYVPNLEEGINFYREDFRDMVRFNVDNTINTGESWDFEAIIVTAKKNEIWIRSIGNAEFVNGKCVRLFGGFQEINEKKLASLELEKSLKSLEDYKYSLDQSAIIAFTDQKGVITYTNDNFCNISGYDREELIGNTHSMINSQYHPESFFHNLWQTIASGNIWRGEIKNKAKDGSYYWVDTTIVPFLNEKNRPNQYLAIRFDITDRKKSAEEKNRFQNTLENSLNEIYMFDAETYVFSYVNNSALLNLGYSEEELKQIKPYDIKPDFDSKSFDKILDPLKSKELEQIIFFTNHQRKDGSLYPVEVHLNLVEEDNNRTFVAIVLDITERKKAKERYRLLADNTNDIIAMQDENLRLNYVSPAATNILGYSEVELLYINLKEIIHKDDFNRVSDAVKELLEGKSIDSLTYRVYNKKGEIVWLESLISSLIENGKIISFVSTSRDITQWMLAKQEIQDYQTSLQKLTREISVIEEKQKKEIAANIHDHLSQSLVISRMRIVDLEKKPELTPIFDDLEFIKDHVSKALENSRKITYELSPPVLYQLGIIDALDWFADDVQEKYNINFEFKSNEETIDLSEFKSILLFRCVQEAVTNTLKYAEADNIILEFIKKDDSIILTLIDDGKGFNISELEGKVSSGSGFGLFAVKERIRNMNGILEITSEKNIGTKIKIVIPL